MTERNDGGPAFPMKNGVLPELSHPGMSLRDWRNDGGPAFPMKNGVLPELSHPGMSLRDWFAGKALAGMLANPELAKITAGLPVEGQEGRQNYAHGAYLFADALLAERSK